MSAYVFIDVSRKQEYIFRSKRLRDNLINSYVIKSVTELPGIADAEPTATDDEIGNSYSEVTLATYLAEYYTGAYSVVYSGGGNSILKFTGAKQAKEFVRGYSLEVLSAYPQLELYISKVTEEDIPEGCNKEDMSLIRRLLIQRADRLKDSRKPMFRRWSYGIERIDDSGKPVLCTNTRQVKDGLDRARNVLHKRLKDRLKKIGGEEKVEITVELSDYKSSDERKSYIGVIALDGNQMGKLFNKLRTPESLSAFSLAIEKIYVEAVADALCAYATSKQKLIKITPVLMSGDDVCLVTNAEDALDITAAILERIRTPSPEAKKALRKAVEGVKGLEDKQLDLTACAGVAIVKVTYPFFDAVQRAEKLCRRAKEELYRLAGSEAIAASFMNWEIVQGQVSAQKPYEKLVSRSREHSHYHIKPLRVDQLHPTVDGVYSYRAFRSLADGLRNLLEREQISASFLEKIKKHLYEGWESYSLLFKLDQTGAGKALSDLVEQTFLSDGNWKYGVRIESDTGHGHEEYRYVLNDLLETIAFISAGKGSVDTDVKV
ncbi:hypothetical protein F4V43_09550 [Paenibacillus spiritus]|uniref:Cas10/Cmr2 second palm domain-containing protein n=1 Tax=Paenibacillus spiritus TaxID=2496557 RepID=A0A5J5G9S6_9BACL|nr:hypothetical protein [Paenibacillus spiritus]KAA9004867.1 hypothetical protein F4V43_09550 [Paenibacillus spiritus]